MVKTAVGSYHYMSPERLLSEKYDASGDIWYVCMYVSLFEKFMSGYYSLPDVCKYVYM
jgi:serine/threonine protein kinase